MSSGFVSGGTTQEEPTERDQEWLDAQKELEGERQRKTEEGKQADGKSLYEVLQQNKAAKQEAFEESIRLKNQFKTLDEDEVEFLDSLLESTRAKEAAVKKETNEQLEAFHRQRQEAEKAALESGDSNDPNRIGAASPTEEEQWSIPGRKRRRPKEKDAFPGVKLRRSSSDTKPATSNAKAKSIVEETSTSESTDEPKETVNYKNPPAVSGQGDEANGSKSRASTSPSARTSSAGAAHPVSSALGLGAYDSDED